MVLVTTKAVEINIQATGYWLQLLYAILSACYHHRFRFTRKTDNGKAPISMSAAEQSSDKSTYVIDAENAAEMARLMGQDRLLTKTIGGLFPADADPSTMHTVLDIASGPGGWVLDVASAYSHIAATGVDISHLMIAYAQSQAQERGVDNAHFKIMNVLAPFDLPDNSFDFVNIRLISAFMTKTTWAGLLQECVRVLRPSGIVCIMDCEFPIANSLALDKILELTLRAAHISGRSYGPSWRNIATTMMLQHFLRDAGCKRIKSVGHVVDWSVGAEAHLSMYQNWMVGTKLVQPFLINVGVSTQEELDRLYQQMLIEMAADDFCAVWYFLSAWGRKPAKNS